MKKEKSCGIIPYYYFDGIRKYFVVEHLDGHYGYPKGHVEDSETELETAIREVKEETNLELNVDTNFRKVKTYSPKENVIKDVVFFVGEIKNIDIKLQEIEIKNYKWFTYEEAINNLMFDTDIELTQEAEDYLNK